MLFGIVGLLLFVNCIFGCICYLWDSIECIIDNNGKIVGILFVSKN